MKQKNKEVGLSAGQQVLGASLLGNMLAGKGVMRAGEGTIRAGEGTIRVDQGF